MNQWYPGKIEGYPVDIFLSDDFSMDWFISDKDEVPQDIYERAMSIHEKSKAIRSVSGAQKVLAEHGWSNGQAYTT